MGRSTGRDRRNRRRKQKIRKTLRQQRKQRKKASAQGRGVERLGAPDGIKREFIAP